MSLVFGITSVGRPELLEQALLSISQHVKDVKWRQTKIIVNIDMLRGEDKFQQTSHVVGKYFGKTEFIINRTPNYARAIRNIFEKADADYLFFWPDDTVLMSDVSFADIESFFQREEDLMKITLSTAHSVDEVETLKKHRLFGLMPTLMKKEFYKSFVGHLTLNENPEYQMKKLSSTLGFSPINEMYLPDGSDKFIAIDLGKKWLEYNRFSKSDHRASFIQWQDNDLFPGYWGESDAFGHFQMVREQGSSDARVVHVRHDLSHTERYANKDKYAHGIVVEPFAGIHY